MSQRHETTLNAREARQGRLGRPVLYVLIGSLILCAIFVGVVLLRSMEAPVGEVPPNAEIGEQAPDAGATGG